MAESIVAGRAAATMQGGLKARIAGIRENLQARLTAPVSAALDQYPTDAYIAAFDAIELQQSYQALPPTVRSCSERIVADHGHEALDFYHRCVLLDLIGGFEARVAGRRIPPSIRELLGSEFVRILRGVDVAPVDFHLFSNELFVKDFAICRLKLLPCGSEAVDVASGIPRSTLLKGGLGQFLKAGSFVATRLGGFRPLYESHWDRRLARLFNEADYNRCYLRTAELLELNPHVRGLFGASWWLDPQVKDVAPELEFLRRVPEENGAKIFRIGPDAGAIRDATTFSRKRRELYEAGKYTPERYMLVWARADLLSWADRFRSTQS